MVGKDKRMTEINNSSSNNDLTRHRPTGLTILALLFIIAGAFTLLAGITTLETALAQASGPILTDLEALFIPLGIEILCIASFVVALGLFTGRSWWVWLVAVVLSIIGLVVNVISLVTASMLPMAAAVVGIAINAIVMYYLSKRNVRQYFGKMASPRESASTTVGV
jgi:integral membrane sensor domain MASE1